MSVSKGKTMVMRRYSTSSFLLEYTSTIFWRAKFARCLYENSTESTVAVPSTQGLFQKHGVLQFSRLTNIVKDYGKFFSNFSLFLNAFGSDFTFYISIHYRPYEKLSITTIL